MSDNGPPRHSTVSSTTLTWGDGRGALYATSVADGATALLRGPLRDVTAAEALHWAFAGERALLLDESAASLITYTLDGREISRTAVPGLAALLRSSGERVTDLAAVHP